MLVRTVVAVAVLGLAGAALWLVYGGPANRPILPPAEAGRVPRPASAADVRLNEAAARVDPTPPAAAASGQLLAVSITCVDAETRLPLPRARVFLGRLEEAGADGGELVGEWAPALTRRDPAGVSGADGRLRVLLPAGRVRAVATAPDRIGLLVIDARVRRDYVLPLGVDRSVSARVVDERGVPCPGVPVALCVDRSSALDLAAVVTTDESGVAHFAHVHLHRQRRLPPQQRQSDALAALRRQIARADDAPARRAELLRARDALAARALPAAGGGPRPWADFVLAIALPLRRPVLSRCNLAALPEAPIPLRLPAVHGIEVAVRAADGAPLRAPCSVQLTSADPALPPGLLADQAEALAAHCGLRADKPAGVERVRFARVGADLPVRVEVRLAQRGAAFAAVVQTGPTEGEVVVRAPARLAWLGGRLCDAQGTPVARLPCTAAVIGAGGDVEVVSLELDADGAFEFALPGSLDRPARLEIRDDRGHRGVERDLPPLRAGRRLALGDLLLADLPVLASGVVRDDRHLPVADAAVLVEHTASIGAGARWRPLPMGAVRADGEGRYTVRCRAGSGHLRAAARATGHASPGPIAVRVGGTHDLRLDRHGGVAVSGLVPEWLRGPRLHAELSHPGGRARRVSISADAEFAFEERWSGVPPGTVDLSFWHDAMPFPLVTISGIEVAPGGLAADPRLRAVDLRDDIGRVRLRAVDAGGTPVTLSTVLAVVLGPTGARATAAVATSGDRCELVLPSGPTELHVIAAGFAPHRAVLGPGDHTVTMDALAPTRVRVHGLEALGVPGYPPLVTMRLRDVPALLTDVREVGARSRPTSVAIDALRVKVVGRVGDGGVAELPLVWPGHYGIHVRWRLAGGRWAGVDLGSATVRPAAAPGGLIERSLEGR